jgi:hypothetical protein
MPLPKTPPTLRKQPARWGVQQAVCENSSGGKEQTDGLIAIEAETLGIAAGGSLLLVGEAFDVVVHGQVRSRASSILAAV